jgi:hypothetical protein
MNKLLIKTYNFKNIIIHKESSYFFDSNNLMRFYYNILFMVLPEIKNLVSMF